jgi:SAM-dependent methyltransferase
MNKYIHDEAIHNLKAAEIILPHIISAYNIKSVLDIGAGIGTWLNVAESIGIKDLLGVDGSWVSKDLLKISENYFIEHDITKPINFNKTFDLIICLEVAEHLPESSAFNLIDILTKHGDLILFSAAVPKQGGQNHINEQTPAYWQELFRAKGYNFYDYIRPYIWNNKDIEWWYRQNIFLVSNKIIEPIFKFHAPNNFYIHPELFYLKTKHLEWQETNLIRYREGKMHPKIYFKLFLKSLFKTIFTK